MQDNNETSSHFDQYKKELDALNLRTTADLKDLVKSLIKPATKLNVLPPSLLPDNSQLESHFGGQPYFESGEQWPTDKNGIHLDFIFQIFNSPELELPQEIELIQFFYNFETFPWSTEDDGWLVKIYKELNRDKIELIETPNNVRTLKFCPINFERIFTLPDWEGIDVYSPNASKLSCVLNEDQPWENYQKTVQELIGEQYYQSQLGGYPRWVQGAPIFDDIDGQPMTLLFQIDSENNPELMWGDVGLIYVLYNERIENLEFILQCF